MLICVSALIGAPARAQVVLCQGASNTRGDLVVRPWPAALADSMGTVDIVNRGVNSQTTADFTAVIVPNAPTYVIPTLWWHLWKDLADVRPDIVILTQESNDAQRAVDHADQITVTPEDVVTELVEQAAAVRSWPGRPMVFVTLVNLPPAMARNPAYARFIRRQNRLIRKAFAPEHIVNFATRFSQRGLYEFEWGTDLVHLGDAGHRRRALRARVAINAALRRARAVQEHAPR
jgi:hypothetical protein